MSDKFSFDKITTHLQTTGYIFQGSQIYNGLSNTWDYGPLGAEIKKNIRPGIPDECRDRRGDLDEPPRLGSDWPRHHLQRPDARLQSLQSQAPRG